MRKPQRKIQMILDLKLFIRSRSWATKVWSAEGSLSISQVSMALNFKNFLRSFIINFILVGNCRNNVCIFGNLIGYTRLYQPINRYHQEEGSRKCHLRQYLTFYELRISFLLNRWMPRCWLWRIQRPSPLSLWIRFSLEYRISVFPQSCSKPLSTPSLYKVCSIWSCQLRLLSTGGS